MPVNNKSYENGKIYRIWSLDTDKIYIGSTCDTLSNRFCSHKSCYKSWKNGKGQFYSSFNLFDLVGVDNCKIELEHNFVCDSKTKLNKEEGRIQRLYKDIIVNKDIAGRTLEEYRQDHIQYQKEYQKEYRQDNKEKKKEYNDIYRQNNKEELNEKKKQKYKCDCGNIYSHADKARHLKTNKHQNYIQSLS